MNEEIKIVNSFEELIQELGFKPGDTIVIQTPCFHRESPIEINFIPHTKEELELVIQTASKENLKKMGVEIWDSYAAIMEDEGKSSYLKEGEYHYLFPGEWFKHLPNGFEVVGLFGERYPFIKETSDDDIRLGCLPYGFVRKE